MSDYQHDNLDKNLTGLHNAMVYDKDGEPSLRVSIQEMDASASLTIQGNVIVTDITGSVEITNDIGNPVPVSGTVDIGTMPELTLGNVSVTFPETQNITGTVSVDNFPTAFSVDNFPTSFEISNEIEIKNDVGNPVSTTVIGTVPTTSGLSIPAHDAINNTYTGTNLTKVEYFVGGLAGTKVATLDMTYDINNNVLTVVKS